MNPQEIRTAALAILADVAPDADLSALDPAEDLRAQLDLDSFDFLSFVTGLDERLGVEVPERDYARLATLDSCVAYLSAGAVKR